MKYKFILIFGFMLVLLLLNVNALEETHSYCRTNNLNDFIGTYDLSTSGTSGFSTDTPFNLSGFSCDFINYTFQGYSSVINSDFHLNSTSNISFSYWIKYSENVDISTTDLRIFNYGDGFHNELHSDIINGDLTCIINYEYWGRYQTKDSPNTSNNWFGVICNGVGGDSVYGYYNNESMPDNDPISLSKTGFYLGDLGYSPNSLIYGLTFYDDVLNINDRENFFSTGLIDNTEYPPSKVNITSPNSNINITLNSTGVNFTFNWSNSYDANGDAITYDLIIGKILNYTLDANTSKSNSTITFYSNNYTGYYNIFVVSKSTNLSNTSFSDHTLNFCTNNWVNYNTTCYSNLLTSYYVDVNNCDDKYLQPNNVTLACNLTSSSGVISSSSVDIRLILWGLFLVLAMFLITRNESVGWFVLGVLVMLFSLSTLHDLTDDTMIYFVGYMLSIILGAISLTNYTLK